LQCSPQRSWSLVVARSVVARPVARYNDAMSRAPLALVAVAVGALFGVAVALTAGGCSSDATKSTPEPSPTTDGAASIDDGGSAAEGGFDGGGGADAARDAAIAGDGGGDAGACPTPVVKPGTGETCVGFGTGDPCKTACGLPAFGYVCFNGGPPSFAGCVQASSTSAFGDTYCCPDDKCVAQPDQDAMCKTAGKPHRFQCPPDGAGGTVAPASGCVQSGSGGSALEHFYCCP
jgi:hypothetical protein